MDGADGACAAHWRDGLAGAGAVTLPVLVPIVRQPVRAAVDETDLSAACERRMAADLSALWVQGLVPGAPPEKRRG
nr:hypothetical protein [uncultured Agathobaculum sp.]